MRAFLRRFKVLGLGVLFLTGGLMLFLQRDVYEGSNGALRLDVWSWMLLIAGVPTTLLGLYYAAVGVRE